MMHFQTVLNCSVFNGLTSFQNQIIIYFEKEHIFIKLFSLLRHNVFHNLQKVPFGDRHSSNTRNFRTNYNHDKNNHSYREGTWINSKSRGSGYSHGRSFSDRHSMGSDSSPSPMNNRERFSSNRAYDMHRFPNINSNDIGPVGPANLSVNLHGLRGRQVEFGSFGPVHLSSSRERNGAIRSDIEHRNLEHRSGSPCSSPDQPSSPHIYNR